MMTLLSVNTETARLIEAYDAVARDVVVIIIVAYNTGLLIAVSTRYIMSQHDSRVILFRPFTGIRINIRTVSGISIISTADI